AIRDIKGPLPKLYIGCSDSRVPETTIFNAQPGAFFTHRNVGNLVVEHDLSLASVVRYAVVHLGVTLVLVCGHTNCGACKTVAAQKKQAGRHDEGIMDTGDSILDMWLAPLKRLMDQQDDDLTSRFDSQGEDDLVRSLAVINVREAVRLLERMQVVREAVQTRGLIVKGALYDVATGLVEEVKREEGVNGVSNGTCNGTMNGTTNGMNGMNGSVNGKKQTQPYTE
ncbi:hypothetical protein KEM55_006336, partial [Ascosphaera atra]